MAASEGNLKIFGDDGDKEDKLFQSCKFSGEEAQQIMFFFNEELNEYIEKRHIEVSRKSDPSEITFAIKHSKRDEIVEIKKYLYGKLHDLNCDVLDKIGLSDVEKHIKRLGLRTKVLPLISEKDIVNIYGLHKEDISRLKRACKDDDLLTENITKREKRFNPSDKSNETVLSPSSTILEFDTKEGLKVKVYKEAITKVKVDAIVNAANNTLSNVGGVALVISKAAGEEMERECKSKIRGMRAIADGQNIVTNAGKLPFAYVIHAVGPRWHSYEKGHCLQILKETVVNILKTARNWGMETVAMPAISSGIFGVPKKLCAAMYISAIIHFSMNETSFGNLKEFHIIDINEDLLKMVKEWYEKWKVNYTCLQISSLLTKMYDTGNQGVHQWDKKYQGHDVKSTNSGYAHGTGNKNYDLRKQGNGSFKEQSKSSSSSESKKSIYGTDVQFYTKSILELKDVDAVVVSEDPNFKGEGALARALLGVGDESYKKEHKQLPKQYEKNNFRLNVFLTKAGKKMPFRHVFHVVIDRMPTTQDTYYYLQNLRGTINEILTRADSLGHEKKMEKVKMSLALPMIGAGNLIDPRSIELYCNSVSKAILSYLLKHRSTKIRQIYLVNNDENFVSLLRRAFEKEHSTSQGHKIPKESDEETHRFKSLDTWRKDKSTHKDIDFDKYFMVVGSNGKGDITSKGNLQILGDDDDDDDEGGDLEDCTICLCEMTCPVRLKECNHAFCKECITAFFKQKPSCPICGTVYGTIYGDQPEEGVAKVYLDPSSLQGFEGKGTSVIVYDFPNGQQGSNHPDPGTPFKGMKRKAFLPRSEEGTRILELLKRAFQQGMTFTVGSSRTSGKEGVLTWNDIHHKTSRTGGPQKYGYPDPEYLDRVKDELACKGIL